MNSVKQTIIDETMRLFSEKGYAATSIRDIANAVDIKSASLYYYINSKKDLLNQIMKTYLTELIDGAIDVVSKKSKPEDKLEQIIKHHVSSHGREKLAALVVDTEYRSLEGENKKEIKRLRKSYENIWTDILNEGFNKGVFHFSDKHITAYALLSQCTGVAHWYREEGKYTLHEITEQYITLGLQMVHYQGGE